MKTMKDLWDAYRDSLDREDLRRFARALLITGPLCDAAGVFTVRIEGDEHVVTRHAHPAECVWNPWDHQWDFRVLPHPAPNLDTTPIPEGA